MTLAWRARSSVMLAFTASLAAMVLYPGGTFIDQRTRGYSLSQNFLSDLGMIVAHDGAPNPIGAVLFVVGTLSLLVGGASVLVPIVSRLARDSRARPFAAAAAAGTLLTIIAFAGVAFTPEDRAIDLHIWFTVWAWRALAGLTLVLGIAFWRAGQRAGALTCGVLAVWLAAYTGLFVWGPALSQESGLMVHVIAQKASTIAILAGFLVLAHLYSAGTRVDNR